MKTSVTKGFIHDSIGDMLTRIRNACLAKKTIVITPYTKTNLEILKIMEKEGFIQGFHKNVDSNDITIRLKYRYKKTRLTNKQKLLIADVNNTQKNQTGCIQESCITNLHRISRPSLRIYAKSQNIPRIFCGTGIIIVSTPEGLMTDREARLKGIGGELLCMVF